MNGLQFPADVFDGLRNPWLLLLLKVTAVLAAGWAGHAALAKAAPRYRLYWWRGTVCALALLFAATLLPPVSIPVAANSPEPAPDISRIARADDPVPVAMERSQPPMMPQPKVPAERPARSNTAANPDPAGDTQRTSTRMVKSDVSSEQPAVATASAMTTSQATSAAAPSPVPLWERISPWAVLAAVWVAGIALAMLRLMFSMLRLRRFLRQATPAGTELNDVCRDVAARVGCWGNVAVLRHSGTASPVLYGVLRPVIVLPEWMCGEGCRADWRSVFAHELSHVRSRDLAWQVLVHAASVLLWFHPLAWRLRRAHVLACELKADHDSASLASSADYIRTLARVALATNGLLPGVGLAMARTSEISRRLSFLKKPLPAPRVRTSVLLSVGVCGTAIVGLLGSLQFARAAAEAPPAGEKKPVAPAKKPQASSKKATARRTVRVTIVDDAGKPFPKATLHLRIGRKSKVFTVDAKGVVLITLPEPLRASVTMRAAAPNKVTMTGYWRNIPRLRRPPQRVPDAVTFRLGKGTTIGGVVVDKSGKPVAGVTLTLSGSGARTPGDPLQSWIGSYKATTNGKGEWRCPVAPAKLRTFVYAAEHPNFLPETRKSVSPEDFPLLRKRTFQTVLQRGVSFEGLVRGPGGKPVAGAVLCLGNSPFTPGSNPEQPTTDKHGHYLFKAVRKGATALTVLAKGFAPQIRQLEVTDEIDSVNFRLKTGKTIRFRVVDKHGKPIAGASVVPDRWLGRRSLLSLYEKRIPHLTGKDGRLAWTFAPAEEVKYDVLKRGYMSSRDNTFTADGKEHVIVLNDVLEITGTVVDAKTKKPVPRFRVTPGSQWSPDRIYWELFNEFTGRNGGFTTQQSEPRKGYVVRVEADGYRPAVSRVVRNDEGKVTLRFELQQAKPIVGRVVTKAGKPVSGANVYICTPTAGAYVRNGATPIGGRTAKLTTAKDGRFKLGYQSDPYALLVVADEGYARIPQSEFETDTKIELVDWARVEGTAWIGAKPAAGARIKIQFDQRFRRDQPHIYFDYGATVDKNGKFVFRKVPPGMTGFVYRQIILRRFGDTMTSGGSHGQPVEFEPGKTVKVRVGGTGRPIVGRLLPPKGAKKPVQWNVGFHSLKLDRPPIPVPPGGRPPFTPSYSIRVKPDGSFRIDDVPPGKYVLLFDLREPVIRRGFQDIGRQVGHYSQRVTVSPIPGGRTDKPLDLGTLNLQAP